MLEPLDKESSTNVIHDLTRKFFKGSLDYNIKADDLLKMTWNKQEEFLDATANNPLLKKYPVKSEFVKLFLKKLISFLENHQEVHDDIYKNLCGVMNDSHEKFCYRHYILGKGLNNIITLKETNNMVVNGTTGLRTWDAAIMLADWAVNNVNMFENKIVLELGSGVGFTGITIAKFCQPQCIILSDCHEDVMRTLEENTTINFPKLQRSRMSDYILFQDSEQAIGVMNLDWNNINNMPNDLNPEIVIGSDIIYDPTIIVPLCNVIDSLCNKNAEVFIAGVIRNEETYNLFLNNIDKRNLLYQTIPLSENVFVEWDLNIQRYLLKINKKL